MTGYQIQQIALYMHVVPASAIQQICDATDALSWERWRRTRFQSKRRKGRPEIARAVYYVLTSLLPVGVSLAILVTFALARWSVSNA